MKLSRAEKQWLAGKRPVPYSLSKDIETKKLLANSEESLFIEEKVRDGCTKEEIRELFADKGRFYTVDQIGFRVEKYKRSCEDG